MSSRKLNVMNYVVDDQQYYICNICGNRMRRKEPDVRAHLKNAHCIESENEVEDHASIPTKLRIMGFHMKEWLKTQFTQSENQNEWQCTLCTTILIGSEPWMAEYNHLMKHHSDILIPVANNRSMHGSSSSTANIIASTVSRSESPTTEMISDISVPFHNGFEEMNENVHKFESHMSVDDTVEDFLQNEDTIDLGNKNYKESRTSIADGNKQLEVDIKCEITDDRQPTTPVFSVSGNKASDQHRPERSNAQGYENSSTNDKPTIKSEYSEHDESDDECLILDCESISSFGAQDSERTNDIGTSANPSRASPKRLSVTSTSHRTPPKRVKLKSSGTDLVDENSSRDANRPLPDSNTTSSSVSSETELLSITDRIIHSMSTEEKGRVLQAVLAQLCEKR